MKNTKKYIKRTAAGILIAVMTTVHVSGFALADTQSQKVEISEYGPVSESSSGSETQSGNSKTTAETTSPAETSSVKASAETDTTAPSTEAAVTDSSRKESSQDSSVSTTAESASATDSTSSDTAAEADSTQSFHKTEATATPEVNANFAILVDSDNNTIVADKNGETRMYPASMTKVMTLLVACDYIKDLSEKVKITQDIVDYCLANDASNCGFKVGETVTMKDLLYGLILPSGADAALALVRHIAGSEEQFVKLMNLKAKKLGISDTTHYTNCTGLYNDDHYTTAKDMALVMKYAAANPYASAILSARSYTTEANTKHSNGISFSNLFLKRIDSQETGGEALMAKTGYVSKAGNCAVSYFTAANGRHYICVTGKTQGAWNVVYAHTALYKNFAL